MNFRGQQINSHLNEFDSTFIMTQINLLQLARPQLMLIPPRLDQKENFVNLNIPWE